MSKYFAFAGRTAVFFCITLLAACGGGGGGGATPAPTSTPAPSAGVTVTPTSGLNTTEAGGQATFTVVLDSQPSADVTISVTSSDTTEGTVDTSSLTFTSANWNTSQTVTITGQDDLIDDGDIPYSITLGAASSNDNNYNGIDPSDPAVTNTDNDTTGITVSLTSGANTTEDHGTATFTVALNLPPTADVIINVSSSDPYEGTVDKSSLTFTSANWNTPQTVTVTGQDDSVDDGNVTYYIILDAAVSSDSNYSGIDPDDVAITNIDNDTAGITVSAISGNTTEAHGTATFTVALNSQPAYDVSIAVASSDTSEGTVSPKLLTFTPSDWADKTVTITGQDDFVVDGDITYSITLGAATSTDTNYSGIEIADPAVTNTDDDTAGITVSPTSGLTTSEAGDTATFTVVLTSEPTAAVTIPVTSSDSSEGTVDTSQLTFTSTNWTAKTVTISGQNDFTVDGDITYFITLGTPSSSDTTYSGIDPADPTVINIDDDTAGITVSAVSGNTTEAGGQATFTVALNSQPAYDVSITVASSDTSEGTVSPSLLTFTPNDWAAKTVTITGQDDLIDDGDVPYSIILGATSSTDTNYNSIGQTILQVTNINDDTAGITVSGVSGDVDETGTTATFTVHLDTQPTANVDVSITSGTPTEVQASPASLTFTTSNWGSDQTVTVTGQDNNHENGNQTVTITIDPAGAADTTYANVTPATVDVTNIDLAESYSVTPMLDSGNGFTMVLASNGSVWGWGGSSYGELCTGTTSNSYPTPIMDPSSTGVNIRKIKKLAAGTYFSLLLKDDGSIYGCGQNNNYQLGITGDNSNKSSPTIATAVSAAGVTATSIGAGDAHGMAIDDSGKVWAWGSNGAGQLGDNSQTLRKSPVQSAGAITNVNVSAIDAGAGAIHSVALDNNHQVYTWGSDSDGQQGNGAATGEVLAPADISTSGSISGKTITAVSSASRSIMALDSTGQAHGWGLNDEYQLGDSGNTSPTTAPVTTVSGIAKIFAGGDKGIAIDTSGNVSVWGDNTDDGIGGQNTRGQLGTGDINAKTTPTAASGWGTNGTAISGGSNFTVILNSDGSLMSSGENNGGITLGRDTSPNYDATPGVVLDNGYNGNKPTGCSNTSTFYAVKPVIYDYPVGITSDPYAYTRIKITDPVGSGNGKITQYYYKIDSGDDSGTIQGPTNIGTAMSGYSNNLTAGDHYVYVWGKHQDNTVDCTPVKVKWTQQ